MSRCFMALTQGISYIRSTVTKAQPIPFFPFCLPVVPTCQIECGGKIGIALLRDIGLRPLDRHVGHDGLPLQQTAIRSIDR